jgi:sugar lactone lactonase YvrE
MMFATLLLSVLAMFCSGMRAQSVTFTADLTPPSSSVYGQQVTMGPVSSAVNLGSVNVCPNAVPNASCTETQVLEYTLNNYTGTLGATQVVTEGIPNLDFKLAYSSCTGPQESGVECLVGISFTPTAPGARHGAVEITDASGHPITTTYLYGIGVSAAVGFSPATESDITTGLNGPQGVAVNAQGDVFYADYLQGELVKVPVNGGLSQVVLDSGFSNPSGVALDGAGNIYIADTGHNTVLKVPPGGGPGVPIGSALSSPTGVAVDGLGDVFISNPPISYVVVVPINGGPEITVGGGYAKPTGIAVDASGNLYVADTGNSRVLKVPPNGGPQTTIGTGFHAPISVAVDIAGNVFVGDTGADGITEVPADGSLQFSVGSGFITPTGMALGNTGNLYVTDKSIAEVVELDRYTPPNLTYASTVVSNISSDSPQWVGVENIGNAPLTIAQSPTTIDPDFFLVRGPAALPYCTAGLGVASGTGCVLSLSFKPLSIGSFTSAYVLADNALDTQFTQSIGLSGTGTGIPANLYFYLNPQAYYGSTFNAVAVSNSPGAITYSLISGPATVSSSGVVTVIGEGLVKVLASQAAAGNYLAATYLATFQAVQAGTTTSITATPVKAGFGKAAKITVTVRSDTTGTPTGMVNIVDGSGSLAKVKLVGGVATLKTAELPPGTYNFSAAYLGDKNFDVSVSGDTTLVVRSTQVTLSVLDANPKYPVPVIVTVAVQKVAAREPHGTITIFDGKTEVAAFHLRGGEDGVITVPILPPLKKGAHTLSASYSGDPSYEPGVSAGVTITVR